MNKKVSVLMSVFNGEKFLERCFKSIWNQAYKDFSIICVNDFSSDSSLDILKKWSQKFGQEKFIIINNESNLGLTKSLNKGLKKVQSPFVARIDSDDLWKEEKLEKQINFLEKNKDYGIVGCNYINIKDSKETKIELPEKNEEIRKIIIKRNPFAHSCVIFSTALIKELGGYDESVKYGQDYDLWLRALPKTKFYNIQEFLCLRSLDEGISVKKQREQMLQCVKTQLKYLKKYNFPLLNYIYLLEPLLVALTPNFIKDLKRKIK